MTALAAAAAGGSALATTWWGPLLVLVALALVVAGFGLGAWATTRGWTPADWQAAYDEAARAVAAGERGR